MRLTDYSREQATSLNRPGCVGMSAVPDPVESGFALTALYFSAHSHSDQHSAPYPQMFVVTSGSGEVSVGAESERVHGGQGLLLPADVLHRFSTEGETMEALALAWNQAHGRTMIVVRDKDELARRAAEWFVYYARQAVELRGRFTVAMSGGSTPRGLYEQLASDAFRTQLDWTRGHFFWGDERAVAPGDAQSNYRMANDTLLSKIPVPSANVHRIEAEHGAEQAATMYDKTLREFFRGVELFPRFDLVLLGLGENGHTASLFPHTRVLNEKEKRVAAEYIEEIRAERITLTAPVINHSAQVMFLVSGKDKADVLWRVWNRARPVEEDPADLVAPINGDVMWLVDDEAAGRFERVVV